MKALKFFVMILLVAPMIVSAKVYRTVADDGSVTFSDSPGKNATVINVPEGGKFQSMDTKVTLTDENTTASNHESHAKKKTPFSYKNVKFTTPTDQQTFWNQTQIPIAVALSPNLREHDQVQIIIDGKAQPAKPTNTFNLQELTRGEHKLKAHVLDKDGHTISESDEVTIYIHHSSQKQAINMTNKAIKVVHTILPTLFSTRST